ncbi:MAG: L-seryl-tRNA(Sec) selenium transferase [Methylococcaceae bacterium TMED69]|nr:MAG: L-seryl-tRNA(Sec) selenium transferase [Methylococcaceae bacterium TMED69]
MKTNLKKIISSIPSIDQLLRDEEGDRLQDKFGRKTVKSSLRLLISEMKQEIQTGELKSVSKGDIYQRLELICESTNPEIKEVLNLTGIVVHTNLGRSLFPEEAVRSAVKVMENFTNLEFDLSSGKRGERERFLIANIKELTGAEDATFVNNNAAAVFLILNTFGMTKEVIISRGELVEIGGHFRIPEIMRKAGAQIVEVGTTNRTHLSDFSAVINVNTGLIMKVYTSNYEIVGFTSSVDEKQLAELAKKNNVPFIVDAGSGNLINTTFAGSTTEDRVEQILARGADLVTFSGDKLLGGPQCGIIAGKSNFINEIRQNPVKRAMRIDKVTVASMFEVLRVYMDEHKKIKQKIPTQRFLNRSPDEIKKVVNHVLRAVSSSFDSVASAELTECKSQVGSGALPVDSLPSYGLKITPLTEKSISIEKLNSMLRGLPHPVIGRITKQCIVLDCRCLESADKLIEQLKLLGQIEL